MIVCNYISRDKAMNVCYEICGITDRGDSAENSRGMIYGCQLGSGRSNYEYYL